MKTCLEMALEMLDMGFSVIPVRPNDKRPLPGFMWQQFQQRQATPEEVEEWFKRWPDANLALVTGAISGIWVLDADGPRGMDFIDEQCPPTSVYQRTPGGGVHAIYRLPRGKTVSNGVRVRPELDIRGEGGYIVIAPSVINGKAYRWKFKEGYEDWAGLFEWFWEEQRERKAGPGNLSHIDLSSYTASCGVDVEEEIAQGGRNNALAKVAGHYYNMGLGFQEVLALCEAWNRANCKPPLGLSEIQMTVESIGRRHITNNPPPNPDLKVAVPEPARADYLQPGGILEQMMDYIDASSAASFPLFNLAAAITALARWLASGSRPRRRSGPTSTPSAWATLAAARTPRRGLSRAC